jgi:hypothetical protein
MVAAAVPAAWRCHGQHTLLPLPPPVLGTARAAAIQTCLQPQQAARTMR